MGYPPLLPIIVHFKTRVLLAPKRKSCKYFYNLKEKEVETKLLKIKRKEQKRNTNFHYTKKLLYVISWFNYYNSQCPMNISLFADFLDFSASSHIIYPLNSIITNLYGY